MNSIVTDLVLYEETDYENNDYFFFANLLCRLYSGTDQLLLLLSAKP